MFSSALACPVTGASFKFGQLPEFEGLAAGDAFMFGESAEHPLCDASSPKQEEKKKG